MFNLLTPDQFGFRPGHSTQTCLIEVTDYLLQNMDDGMFTGAVFLDLKKAFDTVHHKMLLKKLSLFGVAGQELDWFTSYLSGRLQVWKIKDSLSETFLSVLGLAFLRNWPLVTPLWPLTPAMCYTLVRGFFRPNVVLIRYSWAFWPLVDPAWPFDPGSASLWSPVFVTKFGEHTAFISNWPLFDPGLPQHDLWPHQCTTLWSEILLTKFGSYRAFLSTLICRWPLTFRVILKGCPWSAKALPILTHVASFSSIYPSAATIYISKCCEMH